MAMWCGATSWYVRDQRAPNRLSPEHGPCSLKSQVRNVRHLPEEPTRVSGILMMATGWVRWVEYRTALIEEMSDHQARL